MMELAALLLFPIVLFLLPPAVFGVDVMYRAIMELMVTETRVRVYLVICACSWSVAVFRIVQVLLVGHW